MLFFFWAFTVFLRKRYLEPMKLKNLAAIVALFSALVLSGCAEIAGNGQLVAVPLVSISCTTAYCKQNFPAKAYIVYTTSSCANAQFGESVAGSATLTCNSSGCTGTISSFTSTSGSSTSSIAEGFYSICAVLDFNSDYIGTALIGDSTGVLSNTYVTTGTSARNVTSFVDM